MKARNKKINPYGGRCVHGYVKDWRKGIKLEFLKKGDTLAGV